MRVYLDNCCYNRPFDDQSDVRVRVETEAKLFIQEQIRKGVIELVWSSVNAYENSDNPSFEVAERIAAWADVASLISHVDEPVLRLALKFERIGLKAKDALHVAVAVTSGCDYFITTDKRILNKPVQEIRTVSPVRFTEEYLNEE